ncbi:CRISPR-associated endoribonuclease Cas6 [Schwartzia succinivorans]|jgi:CRISPR-associated endoribonuclease Cas6|uniref:CRISPR-associated endoribonuclease Cas6 n=1 Tax=Schwartzia succinivorans DSM 10502 TaxID=1123243 RepID=A0A1M4Z9X0_9FIRM|nr:CRISPR-associated endoribonuclease Cas6 [Schwartzia succinivorans]SHF14840.1 CRISPR-associated endoribonuclease Cas6 [Schwartzia succinivorans DSM 10502]
MIGAVVYLLRAENAAGLIAFHGRLMHGAAFSLLEQCSEELSAAVHDTMTSKPFTVSLLKRVTERKEKGRNFTVKKGELFWWRVTATHEALLRAFLEVPKGTKIAVGHARMIVEDVIADGSKESGVASEADMIAWALSQNRVDSVTFRFISPVSFRNFDRDYPFPLAEFVFASLADKWNQAGMPAAIDRASVKDAAKAVRLLDWKGESRKVYFSPDRGMLAFQGIFTYELNVLPVEMQQIFLLLAQFAEFSGVGRLTGQGFGATRVEFKH